MTTRIALPGDEIHVWFCPLDRSERIDVSELDQVERERAEGFDRPHLRDRWLAGRAHQRRVLGHYLNREAGGASFVYQPGGKPEVAGDGALAFSRSASTDIGAVAVARGGRLGLDIESVETVVPSDGLAEWLFTPDEATWVEAAPEAERHLRFLRLWTVKEAMVKAHGGGLGLGFATFEVEPQAMAVLSPPEGTMRSDWHLASVNGPPGIVCTVARLGGAPSARLRLFN